MAFLELDGLQKRFGGAAAVDGLSLALERGEVLALLGPSGSGKTTTLRLLAGFEAPDAGRVLLDGRDVTALAPVDRRFGMVFQHYALFPHLDVGANVAFGLESRGVQGPDLTRRVAEALALVDLAGYERRPVTSLSGGQQQRVALARALVFRPDVLLLDEPLSNLDAKLRQEVRIEIRELQRKLGITTVMVTHDQEEALTMADRMVVMEDGSVRQVGTQQELYERPANRFVAGFVGRSTFIEGRIEADGTFRSAGGLALRSPSAPPGPAAMALRPERVACGPAPLPLDNSLPGTVEFVSYLGAMIDLHVRISPEERVVAQLPNRADAAVPAVGQAVHVGWPVADGIVFAEAPRA